MQANLGEMLEPGKAYLKIKVFLWMVDAIEVLVSKKNAISMGRGGRDFLVLLRFKICVHL